MAVAGAAAVAEVPPSSPWSPPNSSEPRIVSAPEPTPVVDELPMPTDAPDQAAEFGGPWLLGDVVQTDESDWYQPTYWFGPSPWDTGIELGLNGSTGTNESFSIRSGGFVKRESRFSKLDFSIYHNRTTTGGLTTQHNATTDIRNDWLLDDSSPWTLFAKANVFYDQFQAFDLQSNANSGIGYQFLKDPSVNLTGRVGGGASREFGGPDDEWVPEALFGFEYDQHLTATQKFSAKIEYYPEFEEFGQYRLVADGGWEIELVKPSNISLKISANDRYDSTPNGADPHLVNYSVLLLLKL